MTVKATSVKRSDLIQINQYTYEIPDTYRSDMRVPARFFASEKLLDDLLKDAALWQLVNVATLPGILGYAYAMPDVHQGYGFPIGGVAAFDVNNGGVISPGGIGYDINCGVRLLRSNLTRGEIKPRLDDLATELFGIIPSGVGRGGRLKLYGEEIDAVLSGGAAHMVELGYGTQQDLENCEEGGQIASARPDFVSKQAKARGADQLGTLGSGNHFMELQYVDEIFDLLVAQAFGLRKGLVTIMIHCGSRGLGHQVCTDYVRAMIQKSKDWNIQLADRELVCAPFSDPLAQEYWGAMGAAANYAWANRHLIAHWARQTWQQFFGAESSLETVYDVCHNIGKQETHMYNGNPHSVVLHRKGATRAFAPGSADIPAAYRSIGQPVLVPGTMGTASYVMVGTEQSMQTAFGSCCHGAGRVMSRVKAREKVHGRTLKQYLESQGIIVRTDSIVGLAEEAPEAYKDIEAVIDCVHGAGLASKVARLKPLAVIKGG
jgi:tRNA-splicing ligase RtcB (3'-phosphate/5'-hydroxy nucleic acid ligase)